jgi:ferredoxin-NADP reductase
MPGHFARLERKDCLSEISQCYHFEFVLDGRKSYRFIPGQFISIVAQNASGKQQIHSYSLASAPRGNRFELCAQRVSTGFFSTHLADLTDLAPGETIQICGPYGQFFLRQPLTDSILIATGTGIASMRGFLHWLFPEGETDAGTDHSGGKQIWLIQGALHESDLYYRAEFEALAHHWPNFHYLPTLSLAPKNWGGLRGPVQEHAARIVRERAARLGQPLPTPSPDPTLLPSELSFDIYGYVRGPGEMVYGVRDCLTSLGWHCRQIISERYD